MNKKILVIDDDSDIRELIETALTEAGFVVKALAEFDDIFKVIEEQKPDLILIDYLLRGINGGEFCSQIKHNPKTIQLPVILMSAHSRVLLSLGTYDCDEFIEKPFDIYNLISRLNYYLKNYNTYCAI